MANETTQKRRDGDLANDRNKTGGNDRDPNPTPGGRPGPGHDREAVRRGEASQQTDNGPPEMKPVKADQAAHSNHPLDERKDH